jgi:ATP-binding cassette subfamily B protein
MVEQGTHDYLIDKKGVYAELYEKQTQNNETVEE